MARRLVGVDGISLTLRGKDILTVASKINGGVLYGPKGGPISSAHSITDRCSKKEADDGNGRRALGVGEAVCSLTSTSGSATSGASRDPSPPSPTGHRTAFGLEVAAGLAKKKDHLSWT